MLLPCLERFNSALLRFQHIFPKKQWSESFKQDLINDFSFFSSRIEDPELKYGDTIKFLNNEFVNKENLTSFLQLNDHQEVLTKIIETYENFELSEESIKDIHRNLMGNELSWNGDFKAELVGNYRNYPVSGSREPFFPDKDYAPHYNLEIIMSSHIEFFERKFSNINNSATESHLLVALTYFHNKFLNEIHPFADGNGRVCRIIMGTVMMKNNCPPVFSQVTTDEGMMEYINVIVECE